MKNRTNNSNQKNLIDTSTTSINEFTKECKKHEIVSFIPITDSLQLMNSLNNHKNLIGPYIDMIDLDSVMYWQNYQLDQSQYQNILEESKGNKTSNYIKNQAYKTMKCVLEDKFAIEYNAIITIYLNSIFCGINDSTNIPDEVKEILTNHNVNSIISLNKQPYTLYNIINLDLNYTDIKTVKDLDNLINLSAITLSSYANKMVKISLFNIYCSTLACIDDNAIKFYNDNILNIIEIETVKLFVNSVNLFYAYLTAKLTTMRTDSNGNFISDYHGYEIEGTVEF